MTFMTYIILVIAPMSEGMCILALNICACYYPSGVSSFYSMPNRSKSILVTESHGLPILTVCGRILHDVCTYLQKQGLPPLFPSGIDIFIIS